MTVKELLDTKIISDEAVEIITDNTGDGIIHFDGTYEKPVHHATGKAITLPKSFLAANVVRLTSRGQTGNIAVVVSKNDIDNIYKELKEV